MNFLLMNFMSMVVLIILSTSSLSRSSPSADPSTHNHHSMLIRTNDELLSKPSIKKRKIVDFDVDKKVMKKKRDDVVYQEGDEGSEERMKELDGDVEISEEDFDQLAVIPDGSGSERQYIWCKLLNI
ncbi:hypothetical protein PPACK8108_LOCUS22925 [Phakopsora pachyrhizi]|uniref:Uncharacterized protein n=1 Tax=Phakopsora pachyrhizi TaxID=170000 RepID=A0AAV0BMT5_PHAPC|nr:hypothetical protein PPACK8108_LOCUS22925 [Phakopsora pachyrhizi]